MRISSTRCAPSGSAWRARGVPPYVIFHDTTLRDMTHKRPSSIDELHEIYGVGAKKAADFGEEFLEVIRGVGAQ